MVDIEVRERRTLIIRKIMVVGRYDLSISIGQRKRNDEKIDRKRRRGKRDESKGSNEDVRMGEKRKEEEGMEGEKGRRRRGGGRAEGGEGE